MYLLSKYISENFSEKVIFSGEGADEILCGYKYFHKAPSVEELHKDSIRLVQELPYFDVLRADRCTASHGLELRVPFLDKDLVNFCFSFEPEFKNPVNGIEKFYLRETFKDILPDEIIWRRKEAFSDGVSGNENPFYKRIQDFIHAKVDSNSQIQESQYYHKIFSEKFKKLSKPIPHYWMPKWVEVEDPSARKIEI